MNKEKLLDLLLKDLKKMTDSEVVRNYKAAGISVINYNKDKVGNVDLYD